MEYYYNVTTGQVEEGHQSGAAHLMGPYPSKEAAAKALETAAERTEKWDEEEAAWKEQ